jgi:hypothetical protein
VLTNPGTIDLFILIGKVQIIVPCLTLSILKVFLKVIIKHSIKVMIKAWNTVHNSVPKNATVGNPGHSLNLCWC